MTDIIDFLRARYDEDEGLARDEITRRGVWQQKLDQIRRDGEIIGVVLVHFDGSGAPGDPARVLAEVEAKRLILLEHKPWNAGGYHRANTTPAPDRWLCATCDGDGIANVTVPCPTVRLLAWPYSDHPDYDPTWGPVSNTV